jgi:uncharacterized membrane protein YhaH (DUF805 family)
MQELGINPGYLLIQCLIPFLWITLSVFALLRLRTRTLPEVARAVWAALILIIPVLGALAFFIVQPGDKGA